MTVFFDFLTGIDDFSRMSAFRFKESKDGVFINVSESLKIPPMTDIGELIAASAEIKKSEEGNVLPDRKWVAQLVQPGSSSGGARPKASVIDTDKTLYIAKFPSRKDDYDAGIWEHFNLLLAAKDWYKCRENQNAGYRREISYLAFATLRQNPRGITDSFCFCNDFIGTQ